MIKHAKDVQLNAYVLAHLLWAKAWNYNSLASLSYRVFIKYCFFSKILKYSGLWPFSVFPRCQCVYTHQAGRTPAQQQNWQSSENSQNLKEKHNI